MRNCPDELMGFRDLPDKAAPGDHCMAALLEVVHQKEAQLKKQREKEEAERQEFLKLHWSHDLFYEQQRQREAELA